MDDIRDRLVRRAYLYVDADAYVAGVDAALAAVTAAPEDGDGDQPREPALAAATR